MHPGIEERQQARETHQQDGGNHAAHERDTHRHENDRDHSNPAERVYPSEHPSGPRPVAVPRHLLAFALRSMNCDPTVNGTGHGMVSGPRFRPTTSAKSRHDVGGDAGPFLVVRGLRGLVPSSVPRGRGRNCGVPARR